MIVARIRRELQRRLFRPLALTNAVRVGVIGAGKAAEYHLTAVTRIRGAQVPFICNTGNERGTTLARRFGIGQHVSNLDEALNRFPIDAAIVAVPPRAVVDIARRLFDRGIPCLIEKPLGSCAAEARQILGASSATLPNCVGLNRRMLSSVIKAWEITQKQDPLYAVHLEAPEPIDRRYKQQKFTVEELQRWLVMNSIHAIDLLTMFCGPSADVLEMVPELPFQKRSGKEDYCMLIGFENGAVGSYVSHWHSPGSWKIDLFAKNSRISVDLQHNVLNVQQAGGSRLTREAEPQDVVFKPGVYRQDYSFLAAVSAGTPLPSPMASLSSAVQSMELAEKMLSLRSQRSFV